MEAKITWSHDRVFIGESGTGHGVVMSSIGDDGTSLGPTPMEMVPWGDTVAYELLEFLHLGEAALLFAGPQ